MFSNFPKFLKIAPKTLVNVIAYIFESYNKLLPSFITPEYINFVPQIINFPLIETMIQDYSYKQHLISCRNGRLMIIKNAFVLKTYQPEYFLWRQEYNMPCHCDDQDVFQKTINLPSLLRINFDNIRSETKSGQQKCKECGGMLIENTKARVFLPCQRVDVFIPSFANCNNNGIFPLWLYGNNIEALHKGDTIFAVVYYDIYLSYTLIKERFLASMSEFFIAYNLSQINHVVNQNYFAELITRFWQYEVKTQWDFINYDLKNYDYILHSWYCLKKCISVFAGEFFPADFLNLKLALLFSVVLVNRLNLRPVIEYHSVKKESLDSKIKDPNTLVDDCINIFICSNDDEIIMRAILAVTKNLENFHVFPTVYDNYSLLEFLLKVNGGILLIKDPNRLKKTELDIVNQLLKRGEICVDAKYGAVKISCAVWMIASEPIIKPPKSLGWKILTISDYWPYDTADSFDIIVDLCRENNIYKGISIRFDKNYCNMLVESMTQQSATHENQQLAQRPNINSIMKSLSKNIRRVEKENMEEVTQKNHRNAISLLKKFYIGSRRNKKISISSLNSMRKIANASSILRCMANGIEKMYSFGRNGEIYLEVIDTVIGIMFNEETSLNKQGPENVVFGGKVTRFFMNQNQDLDEVEGPNETLAYLEKSDKQFLRIYQDILDFLGNFEERSYDC